MVYDFSTKKDQVILFMDILGFSAAIKENDSNDTQTKQDSLIVNMQVIFETMRDVCERHSEHIKFLWASDSLLFSADKEYASEIMPYLFKIQRRLLNEGLPVRGAICVGNLYHENNVWGEALVRAVELEKKTAIYPRIIVSKEDYAKLPNMGRYAQYFCQRIDDDDKLDDYLFVDTLAFEIDEVWNQYQKGKPTVLGAILAQIIKRIKENIELEKVGEKWAWLAKLAAKDLQEKSDKVIGVLNAERNQGKPVHTVDEYIDIFKSLK